MNYIKGFRYQLYCAAREAGVRNCTVHVAAIPSDCISRNANLSEETRYQEQTIGNLISRFEEPNGSTRWDSPLVVFPWCDSLLPSHGGNADGLAGNLEGLRVIDQSLAPSDETSQAARQPKLRATKTESTNTITMNSWSSIGNDIWIAVTRGDLKPATAAVKAATRTSTNFLHLLESTTSSLISDLLTNLQQSPNPYGTLTFPFQIPQSSRTKLVSIKIPMGKTVNLGTLQRLRRQYTTLQKQANFAGRGNKDGEVEEMIDGFVLYLQGTL